VNAGYYKLNAIFFDFDAFNSSIKKVRKEILLMLFFIITLLRNYWSWWCSWSNHQYFHKIYSPKNSSKPLLLRLDCNRRYPTSQSWSSKKEIQEI